MSDGTTAPRSPRISWRFVVAALAVYAVHLTLLVYFLPLEIALSDEAISGGDFATHLAQTARVVEGLQGWGKSWVYDVNLLAGHPTGTIFDADNKGWEIWTWLAMGVGLPFARASNSFLVSVHLLVPVVVFVSARLFGLERWTALVAAAFGSALWFFDSFTHWCWWAGMIEYDFGGYLCLLPFALFYRFMQRRTIPLAVLTGVVLGLTLLVHPYTFIILAVPMTFLWLRQWRELTRRDHILVIWIAAIAVLLNAWWLAVAFRFWHYILDSAYFGQAGVSFFFADVLGTLLNPETTGFLSTRTGFRLLFLAASFVMVVRWRREGDPRGTVFAVALGCLVGFTYLGSYTFLEQVQPYRFVLPTAYVATIPAACLLVATIREWRAGAFDRRTRALAFVVSVPALQHLASDVIYFMPEEQPEVAKLSNGMASPLTGSGYLPHPTYRYMRIGPDKELIEWIREHDDGTGRTLVELPSLGDELSWQTHAQVLGGFTHRNLEHSWANLYRRRPQGIEKEGPLRKYFETYAVKWVIASTLHSWFVRVPNPLLEEVAVIGPHHVYRTKVNVNLVARGGGTVTASTNRLVVRGSNPNEPVILRYHWMETLVCEPDCEIQRAKIDDVDPVGFVAVPAPHPADFEIVNAY